MLVAALLAAGGCHAEELRPEGIQSQVADIFFQGETAIVEVKSLTTDRPTMSSVQLAVGEQLARDAPKFGGPIVYGKRRVELTDLPEPTAKNVLRKIGQPVIDAVKKANKQIKATKSLIGIPDALGCVGLICPPHDLDHKVLAWLVADAVREGKNSSVNCVIIAQTPLLAPFGIFATGSSAMMFVGRDGQNLPESLRRRIGAEWATAHGQEFIEGYPEPGWHGQSQH